METRFDLSGIAFLRPELLWLAVVIVPLLMLAALRIRATAAWRRNSSLVLQIAGVVLLVLAIAEPAVVKQDDTLSVTVVLDTSGSLSAEAREQVVAYAKGVQQAAAPTDNLHFIASGDEATELTPEQVEAGDWLPAPEDAARVSDLEAGLRLAGSLMGDSGRRRVVLVSDGWETRGRVADEASRLSVRGIDVQVVALTALGSPEVVVSRLWMQPYARIGDVVISELQVYSTQATSATLSLSVDGALASGRQVSLREGDNTIEIEQRAMAPGFHSIEASLQTGSDTSEENNAAAATLVVKPRPRVLLLQERDGEADAVAAALRQWQIDADIFYPVSVPTSADNLEEYDAVVMVNTAATSYTLDQQRTLQEFVRRNGKGLVVVGGQTAYGKGDYMNSIFEEVLPVSSEPAPRPQEGTTALILILDRSSSMREYGSQSDANKFEMAIEAARLAVGSMRQGDQLGLIAFDDEYEWAVPMQELRSEEHKQSIQQQIMEIEVGRTTAIYPAVDEAARMMRTINAPTRHLVLLTDGREQRFADYGPLLDRLRSDEINLSAIGIGTDTDRDLLTRLAREGRGRFYFTEQPDQIPKIVFKEIDLTLREATLEGVIQPHLSALSPVLRGLTPADLPQLSGYGITVAKDEAVTALTTDTGDPLLAHWQYGLGRVVAFTSEAGPNWGANWLTWDEFGRFWNQAARWSMASPVNRLLVPSVQFSDEDGRAEGAGVARVVVESLNPDNTFADLADITAGVRSASGVVTTTLLQQTAPGRYEATVPVGETGTYEVRVRRAGDGDTATGETVGFAVPTGEEYLRAGTNDRLLKQLNGGAAYLRGPEQALDPVGLDGASPDREPLWPYFVAPALLLLLASVAVRRVDFRFRRA
jgi:Ca-activated chloride channel family protein